MASKPLDVDEIRKRIVKVVPMRLGDILPNPHNPKSHPASQRAALRGSVRELGFGTVPIAYTSQRLGGKLAFGDGHMRGDEFADFITDVAITDYTDEEIDKFLLYADPIAAMAEYEAAQLDSLLRENQTSDEALVKMLAGLAETAGLSYGDTEPKDAPVSVDKADELQRKWQVQPGELFVLVASASREHRLVCGDCTDKLTVDRLLQGDKPVLMVTDPPYGVSYDPAWRNDAAEKGLISYAARSVGKVENDNRVDWSEAYRHIDAQVAYVWHADRHAKEVQSSLEAVGYEMVCQIIWAKPVFAISRGDYHWQHEPCWYAVKKGKNHNWQGSRSESTLWQIERGIPEKTGHGTEKPSECMARPIRNNSKDGEIVCDPFIGSGTTLIAVENLKRQCRACEIYPPYVAVCLERVSMAFPEMDIQRVKQ